MGSARAISGQQSVIGGDHGIERIVRSHMDLVQAAQLETALAIAEQLGEGRGQAHRVAAQYNNIGGSPAAALP